MANTTFAHAKAIALTDYLPAFRQSQKQQGWNWQQFTTMKSTKRATEQVYSTAGLGVARRTDELEPIYYADVSELDAISFVVYKYTLASMWSHELLSDQWHSKDLFKDAGSSAGDSHRFAKDAAVAAIFNNAFSSSYPVDPNGSAAALCDSHTTKGGTTFDNDLTPASITYDNFWLMYQHFQTSLYSQDDLYLSDEPGWIVYHPSKEKQVQTILKSSLEPGTGDNDKNLLKSVVTPVPCRHLTSTTAWFILGKRFKNDLIWYTREGVRFEMEKDFDRMGTKHRSFQRFAVGARDYTYIVGNPGS